eukprot:1014033_1
MSKPKRTFYRRKLPSPPAIAFTSPQGRLLFKESLKDGFMEGYFILAEQFRTQDEPTFCGLSTLTMVLNTLAVDPKRVWKDSWRWYSESMLDCCRSLDQIKAEGITFDQFVCLGRYNSLSMIVKRPNQRHLYPTRDTKVPTIQPQIDAQNDTRQYFTLDAFRKDVMRSCLAPKDPVIIVSYSRAGLQQTGDGHFSPIAGYHKQKDMLLIMDVARFKYPPHWVKTEVLYDAMCRMDKTCNKTRGWIIVSYDTTPAYVSSLNISAIEQQNAPDWYQLKNETICEWIEREINQKTDASSSSGECSKEDNMSSIEVIRCLLSCVPVLVNNYIAHQAEKFGIILQESHEEIKGTLMQSIREVGMYRVVRKIFEDKENYQLVSKFEKCLDVIEMVTLMVLVIGNGDVWDKISDEIVAKELIELTTIDQDKHPELNRIIRSVF